MTLTRFDSVPEVLGLNRTSDPAKRALTFEDAKRHLRVDDTDQDEYIQDLCDAAIEWGERFTRRAFITQTWTTQLNRFPDGHIALPRPPLQSVSSVTYIDTEGATQTWDSSKYTVVTGSLPGYIELNYGESYPDTRHITNAVTVTFIAGYGLTDSSVPAGIKHALRLAVGNWHENREPVVVGTIAAALPMSLTSLLYSYRVLGF